MMTAFQSPMLIVSANACHFYRLPSHLNGRVNHPCSYRINQLCCCSALLALCRRYCLEDHRMNGWACRPTSHFPYNFSMLSRSPSFSDGDDDYNKAEMSSSSSSTLPHSVISIPCYVVTRQKHFGCLWRKPPRARVSAPRGGAARP
jgi:hypothetical protein